MPFKVRGKLIGFMNDPEKSPCHFDYQIGEEFTYDGERIEGRICPGVLLTMVPHVWQTFFAGKHANERVLFKYSALSLKDPSLKKYDGIGVRPVKELPEDLAKRANYFDSQQRPEGLQGRTGFSCFD